MSKPPEDLFWNGVLTVGLLGFALAVAVALAPSGQGMFVGF